MRECAGMGVDAREKCVSTLCTCLNTYIHCSLVCVCVCVCVCMCVCVYVCVGVCWLEEGVCVERCHGYSLLTSCPTLREEEEEEVEEDEEAWRRGLWL